MDKLVPTPAIGFNPNQLSEVRALNGYENKKQISQAVDNLDEWIKKQNHFVIKDFGRDYLERVIIFNKGSVERAKQRMDRSCTLRNLVPEFMGNMDIENEFENFRKIVHVSLFPKSTKDNCRILLVSVIKPDDSYNAVMLYRYTYLIIEYLTFNDYCAGIEVILNLTEFSFSMLNAMNPSEAHKGVTMVLQIMGMRLKAYHVICSNKYIEGGITLFKSFLSDKLKKRIHVHNSYKSVCKVVDKSVLPVEIGGEYRKTVKELSDELFTDLCSETNMERINFLEKAVTIESQRLSSTFNEEYSGMPGSFKTLCVD